MDDEERSYRTMSIAEAIADADGVDHVPVTFDRCAHVVGPFFHGTSAALAVGDLIGPGQPMNHDRDRIANHVYFSALLEPAVWGAELAVAHTGGGPARIYVVEPLGPFEDDPNVTNKRFPGNVTRSYRTRQPMRVVDEVQCWDPHPPEVLQGMLDNLARLRAEGLDVVYD
ncbi:MAG: NAD(+)--rifampin ADP-ribosyltransferase [Acidimicrobiales bacterium]|nr:NAD(+)--rifampin ADP-ribosyltransferase [Acidimicrobiales bacterium]